jgi:hypothetical protein
MINPSEELQSAFLKWWIVLNENPAQDIAQKARVAWIRLRWEQFHNRVPMSFREWIERNPLSRIG